MKILVLFIINLFLMCFITSANSMDNTKGHPFSFKELLSAEKAPIPSLQYLEASDNTKLAYREYVPEEIMAVLLFYHGGGAHSGVNSGYEHIGNGLSKRFNIAVITPDIRGHGDSEGERGDTPSTEQVFDDVNVFVRHIRNKYPKKPLFIGGHSSGAGLILNYSNSKTPEKVHGYLFLSPQLGFRSKTERENNPNPFLRVETDLFIKNAMQGTHGNSKAVFFNYPEENLEKDPKLLTAITVNMANATTPTSPARQIQEINMPLAVWIGEEDELFDPVKVTSFVKENNPNSYTKIIKGEKHLSILLTASNYIGSWIHDIVESNK